MPEREATSDSTRAVEVTMKMMRRTRNTSVSGVMLISATTVSEPTSSSPPPEPLSSCTFIPTAASYEAGAGAGVGEGVEAAGGPTSVAAPGRRFVPMPRAVRNSSVNRRYCIAIPLMRATK